MLYNVDGRWCHDTLEKRLFITTAQLTRLYGADCILREVDFLEDREDSSGITLTLYHMTDGKNILFGNKYFTYCNQMCALLPMDNSVCSKLIYK